MGQEIVLLKARQLPSRMIIGSSDWRLCALVIKIVSAKRLRNFTFLFLLFDFPCCRPSRYAQMKSGHCERSAAIRPCRCEACRLGRGNLPLYLAPCTARGFPINLALPFMARGTHFYFLIFNL